MNRRIQRRRLVVLAAVVGAGLILAGCYEGPDGGVPDDRWWSDPQTGGPVPQQPGSAGLQHPAAPQKPDVPGTAERYCSIIVLNPDKIEDYVKLHERVPPAVKKALRDHNIRDYSIFLKPVESDEFDDQDYVVRYYQYIGPNHEVDVTMLARNPDYREWRDACEACQVSLLPPSSGEWWAPMGEIFHND